MIVQYARYNDGTPFGCVVALWDDESQIIRVGVALHSDTKQISVDEKSLRNVDYILKKDRTKGITRRVVLPWNRKNRDMVRKIAIGRAYSMGQYDRNGFPKNMPRTMPVYKQNIVDEVVAEVEKRAARYFKQASPNQEEWASA